MAVTYSAAVKAARMHATCSQFAGGEIEIVSAMGTRLACFRLVGNGGKVEGDAWMMMFDPAEVIAEGSGKPTEARILTAKGEVGLSGLTVGPGKDVEITYPEKAEALISAGQMVGLAAASIVHA